MHCRRAQNVLSIDNRVGVRIAVRRRRPGRRKLMADTAAAEADVSSLMGNVEQVADGLVAGFYARLAALTSVPAEVDSLQASFAAAGTSFTLLCLQIVLVVAVVLGTFVLVDRWLKRMSAWAWRVAQVLCARDRSRPGGGVGFIAARLLGGAGLPLRTLRLWAVVAVVGPIILADPADGADGLAADPISGTLRPYEGARARPVAGVRLGDHRHHRRCDVAALERRAGPRGI